MGNIISGTGSYIPEIRMKNEDFISKQFFDNSQKKLQYPNEVIIKKFKAITGIQERRYVREKLNNSDIASIAAERAIKASHINPEEENKSKKMGILSWASQSYTLNEAYFLFYGNSNNPKQSVNTNYIKMQGRKIYEFALTKVPLAMKAALEKSNIDISAIKKILIHQANEKMDEAIIKRFYKLYDKEIPQGIMPMSIHKLGNSSVATVPTLYDLILNEKLDDHFIKSGEVIILASVGAGMNINAIVYRH